MFINYTTDENDASDEDFGLQSGSPAIDNGVDLGAGPSHLPIPLNTDILGNVRTNPDCGAYEYVE